MNKNILEFVEKKRKIIVFGNTCSGKSTLIHELNGAEYPQIDSQKQLDAFLKSHKKFSTVFCADQDNIEMKMKEIGLKSGQVGIIFANPDFTYKKVSI